MRKYLLLVILAITSATAFSQDFSNKGKDFWVGYGYHQIMTAGNAQQMVLYFATDQVTNITISIPGTGYTQNITTAGGTRVTTSAPLPKNGAQDARLMTEGLLNRGIHITSDKPMVAYAHIYNQSVSGASILFPTPTLGKEYYSINYTNISNSPNSNCWMYVIATDPGTTTVEITPTGSTIGGWTPGNTYTVTLNQGEIYNIMATYTNSAGKGDDLTGTLVKSISSGSGGCKRIGVFSGSGRIAISCDGSTPSSDNYMVQSFPKSAWGQKYLTASGSGGNTNNIYRICVQDPTTIVKVNGSPIPILGFFADIAATSAPQLIEADKPITVAQYFTSQGACGNGNPGDPEVIYLSPVEQNIDNISWNATSNYLISQHYVNVIIPNKGTGISSFQLLDLNGSSPVQIPHSAFTVHPQEPNYSYLKQTLPISGGIYQIKSDSGFNAIAYGFGSAESYGYNAGTNIKDLYQQIGVSTQYGIESIPSVCTGTPFKFKVSLPYLADSLDWDLSALPAGTLPNTNFVRQKFPPSTVDSITVLNGKNIYWYSLPLQYMVPATGTFTVLLKAYNSANPNGCGVEQEIEFPLVVNNPPVAGTNVTVTGGCFLEPYTFTDNTVSVKPTYSWYWEFGDPASGANNTSGLKTPTHQFTAPGTYTVRFATITVSGCLSDTIQFTVVVPDLPEATITGNATVCINDPVSPVVTFAGTEGSSPDYIFTYNIDNGSGPGPNIDIPSNATGGASITVPTNVAGTFIYTLVSVRNKNGTVCATNYPVAVGTQVTVVVRPDATLTLTTGTATQTVCINKPIVDLLYTAAGSGTGADVVNPALLPPGVTAIPTGNTVRITGTPTSAGTYNFSIQSQGPCVNPVMNAQIIVTPDAVIGLQAGPATQTACINTLISTVTYQVTGSGNNGTVTGLPAGVTGTYSGGIITIQGIPTASGTFNYTATATGPCEPASLTGTITVTEDATNTLTSAAATANQTLCINNPIANITYAIGGSGTNATVTGLPAGVVFNYVPGTPGVLTISGTPTAFGNFPYTVTPVGPCAKPQLFGNIFVNNDATIGIQAGPATQTVCINTLISTVTYQVTGGGTSGTVTGLPAGVSGTYSGGIITIQGIPTVAGTFTYTATATGPCLSDSETGTITVTGDATNTLTSAPATANQILCVNNAITNIIYSIGGTGTNATVTGLPAGVSAGYAAGVLTITGTPTTPGNYPYTVTPVGPCAKPQLSGNILVNDDAKINLTSAPATTSQEVCKNTLITPIVFTLSGAATNASITPALPAGLTGTYNPTLKTYTIQGTPTVAASTLVAYTVTATGGSCIQNTAPFTLIVNELPSADFTYSAITCEDKIINFNDASTPNAGALDQFTWNFGDGSPVQTVTTPTISYTYSNAGTFPVTLRVRTDKGCFSNPVASKNVIVSETPNAAFTVPEACITDNVVFPNTSTAPAATPIAQWEWLFDDPASGASNTQVYTTAGPGTHTFATTGNHNVRLVITTSAGCTDTVFNPIYINGQPTTGYNITNSGGLCSSDSVVLTNTSTITDGTILYQEIYWDNIGDPGTFVLESTPATGNTYKHKYPTLQTTQTYEIRVRSYSGTTCFDDEIRTITVYATPKVQFNSMPDVCYDAAPFQITQASEIGGVPGTATYSGPGVSPTGIFDPVAAGVGTHTIKYLFTATAAGCVDSLTQTIKVRDTATANFTYAAIRCEGSAVSFNSNTSTIPAGAGNITGWEWDFGDPASGANNTSTAPAPSHTYATYGNYNVTLRVTSDIGCRSTYNLQSVRVDPIPTPLFAFDKPSYCIPNAIVTFNNGSSIVSGSALSYNWQFGDLATSTDVSPTHRYTTEGPFNVMLTVTSAEGCVHDTTIVLNTIHPQPKAAFTTSKPAVCIDNPVVTFTDASDGKDGAVIAWNWDFGDGQTDVINPVTHTYATAKDYNVKLYVVNSQGCNSDTLTKVFTVDPLPTVNAGPDRFVLENGQITLQPEVTGTNLSYLWTPNLYMVNNRERNAVVRNPAGDVTYRLTVTAKGGCVSSDDVFVKLLKSPKIPNTFTPNNDGINDTWRIDFLNTYPNNRVQVFTRAGQLVFESKGYNTPWDGTLRGKPLPIDTYYYIIEPNNGRDPITGYVTILK